MLSRSMRYSFSKRSLARPSGGSGLLAAWSPPLDMMLIPAAVAGEVIRGPRPGQHHQVRAARLEVPKDVLETRAVRAPDEEVE
jgi:hypothetical protein